MNELPFIQRLNNTLPLCEIGPRCRDGIIAAAYDYAERCLLGGSTICSFVCPFDYTAFAVSGKVGIP